MGTWLPKRTRGWSGGEQGLTLRCVCRLGSSVRLKRGRVPLPMWPGAAFQVSAIELVDALEGNGTTFFVVKPFRDFFPCLALAPLLLDEFDVGFQPAMER